ncbi:hypothetical protein ACFLZH_01990 [Patescibacteria group bacterium]
MKPLEVISAVDQLDDGQVKKIAEIIASDPDLSIGGVITMVTSKAIAIQDGDAFDREFADRLQSINS